MAKMDASKDSNRMLEGDIKALTLNYLRDMKIINQDSIIMSELTVGNYLKRVDLAILTKGKLIAFEIKSEADSLYRLEEQVHTYLKYFDMVIVASDTKFISKITHKLPKSVGLWEINKSEIKIKSKGTCSDRIESSQLIDYMDVVDLAKLASNLKIPFIKNRNALKDSLANVANESLRLGVQQTLSRKFRESNLKFVEETVNKIISKDDLRLLSRFSAQREKNKLEEMQSNQFWLNIDKHIADLTKFVDSETKTAQLI